MKKELQQLASRFGLVIIDWETAEYLACVSGQIPWGNQKRRAQACNDLGEAMQGRPMNTSLECFQDPSWEISTKKK